MATACAAFPNGRALPWQLISLTANSMGMSLHHCIGVQGPHLNTFFFFLRGFILPIINKSFLILLFY